MPRIKWFLFFSCLFDLGVEAHFFNTIWRELFGADRLLLSPEVCEIHDLAVSECWPNIVHSSTEIYNKQLELWTHPIRDFISSNTYYIQTFIMMSTQQYGPPIYSHHLKTNYSDKENHSFVLNLWAAQSMFRCPR